MSKESRDDPLRLADIADQIKFIEKTLAETDREGFYSSQVLKSAMVFALQVIGEASNHLSIEMRIKIAKVDWDKVRGLRNRIAHGYFALDYAEIWRIATEDVPLLKQHLQDAGVLPEAG